MAMELAIDEKNHRQRVGICFNVFATDLTETLTL